MTDAAQVTAKRGMTAVWFGFAIGPAAWAVHIVGQAALVAFSCNAPRWSWTLHLLTVVTAVPTAVGLALCLAAIRRSADPEDAPSPSGRTRFVAAVGALTAAISLALILWEGSYVFFISRCHR